MYLVKTEINRLFLISNNRVLQIWHWKFGSHFFNIFFKLIQEDTLLFSPPFRSFYRHIPHCKICPNHFSYKKPRNYIRHQNPQSSQGLGLRDYYKIVVHNTTIKKCKWIIKCKRKFCCIGETNATLLKSRYSYIFWGSQGLYGYTRQNYFFSDTKI